MASAKQRKQQSRFKIAAKKAKKLYKTGRYKKYSDAMKAALTGTTATPVTVGARKKIKRWQTGKSDKKRDEERTALKPGKRKSRSGVTYYERRKNRSDMPNKLTGTSKGSDYNYMLLRNMNERNRNLQEAESRLIPMQRELMSAKPGKEKNIIRGNIKSLKKYMSTIKKELRMLKALMK